MYNAEVREKVGGLHLMKPTNFFRVIESFLTHAARNAERSGYGSKNRD